MIPSVDIDDFAFMIGYTFGAGYLFFDPKTFKMTSVNITFPINQVPYDEFVKDLINAACAFSAVERDKFSDELYTTMYKHNFYEYENSVLWALSIMYDINKKIQTKTFQAKLKLGKEVSVYDGDIAKWSVYRISTTNQDGSPFEELVLRGVLEEESQAKMTKNLSTNSIYSFDLSTFTVI